MKPAHLLIAAAVGGTLWFLKRKRDKEFEELSNFLLPPNSGPVVNGLGNLFNQAKIMRRSTPHVQRRSVPQITSYVRPTRPQFKTPLFFR